MDNKVCLTSNDFVRRKDEGSIRRILNLFCHMKELPTYIVGLAKKKSWLKKSSSYSTPWEPENLTKIWFNGVGESKNMTETRNLYRILARKILWESPLVRSRSGWKITLRLLFEKYVMIVGELKAVLPLRRRDCDSIKKKVDYTFLMASRRRIVVALVGEAPLRTEGSTSRRL
jgi:hypothetical protein